MVFRYEQDGYPLEKASCDILLATALQFSLVFHKNRHTKADDLNHGRPLSAISHLE